MLSWEWRCSCSSADRHGGKKFVRSFRPTSTISAKSKYITCRQFQTKCKMRSHPCRCCLSPTRKLLLSLSSKRDLWWLNRFISGHSNGDACYRIPIISEKDNFSAIDSKSFLYAGTQSKETANICCIYIHGTTTMFLELKQKRKCAGLIPP